MGFESTPAEHDYFPDGSYPLAIRLVGIRLMASAMLPAKSLLKRPEILAIAYHSFVGRVIQLATLPPMGRTSGRCSYPKNSSQRIQIEPFRSRWSES